MENTSKIGKRLKEIRDDMRLNQEQFGMALGKKQHAISYYEKGRLPDLAALKKIIELGYSIDWLLTGQGNMKSDGNRIYLHKDNDFSVISDSKLPHDEKQYKLLKLIKELVNEYLKE